jgi:hypothetical protein
LSVDEVLQQVFADSDSELDLDDDVGIGDPGDADSDWEYDLDDGNSDVELDLTGVPNVDASPEATLCGAVQPLHGGCRPIGPAECLH